MQRLAILGGTFDPIHYGHLRIAEVALGQLTLDRILWIPAFNPPHKHGRITDFHHRLAMVQQAIAPYPAFLASDVEAQTRQSYAIVTLEHLQISYSNAQWYWILGVDAFQSLPQWHSNRSLVKQCIWLVAPRLDPQDTAVTGSAHAIADGEKSVSDIDQILILEACDRVAQQIHNLKWHLLAMQPIAISSSLVRHQYQRGNPINHLVPTSVRLYIQNENLYLK